MPNGSAENQVPPPRQKASVRLHRFPDDMPSVQDEVLGAISGHDYPAASEFALRLVLEEAITNAFRHGNKLQEGRHVDVEWAVEPDQVVISVEDQGEGFDPGSLPDPTDDDRLELPSGRGVMLIHAYMTEVSYNGRGNRVTMTYRKPS